MLGQLPFSAGVVRFRGRCPIKWFWPVSRVLIGIVFINAAQAKMASQQGRKGHRQKTTADSPAKYLIAVTMNRFFGPTDGALTSWSPDEMREEGPLSAAPHLGQKICPASARLQHWGQVFAAVFRSLPSIHGYHTVSLDLDVVNSDSTHGGASLDLPNPSLTYQHRIGFLRCNRVQKLSVSCCRCMLCC
jgi:hypothetical protein